MTSQQREQAVSALAALIGAWQHTRIAAGQDLADPATPLPLPGLESDTDQAA